MHTEHGYIQKKNYDTKPEPFYHAPVPYWDKAKQKYKIGWVENAELKAEYEQKQASESFKTEMLAIFCSLSEGDQALYEAAMNRAIAYFDEGNIVKVKESITTSRTFDIEELETVKAQLLNKLEELEA